MSIRVAGTNPVDQLRNLLFHGLIQVKIREKPYAGILG